MEPIFSLPRHARQDSNTAWGLGKDLAWGGAAIALWSLLCNVFRNHKATGRHGMGDGILHSRLFGAFVLSCRKRLPAGLPECGEALGNSLGPGSKQWGEVHGRPAEVRKNHVANTNSQRKKQGTNLPFRGMLAKTATWWGAWETSRVGGVAAIALWSLHNVKYTETTRRPGGTAWAMAFSTVDFSAN